jgi:predicted HicB family RNase H-like nuclease
MSEQAAEAILNDEAVTEDPNALRNLMQRFASEKSATSPKKAERKAREKKARGIADGRSLKAKGRTTQFNVMIKPEIKQAIVERAAKEGISMADLTERAFLLVLGMRSN